MSSFYTQQSQTLFSANHFTNQTVIQPLGMVYNQNPIVTVPRPRLVYVLAPNAYVPKQQELPADWVNSSQPMPSKTHRVSKPPQQAFFEEPAFSAEEPKVEDVTVPPAFERHLSDPSFLLQTEEEKKEAVPEPPKFVKELSDPSFLLDGTAQVEEILEVLDEWTYEPPEEPLRLERERSRSSESGSSAISYNRNKVQRRQIVQQQRERKPIVENKTQIVAPKVKTQSVKQGWQKIQFVTRRKRKRKTIQPGQVYKTKRFVKVTKEINPVQFGKPKRRERDPNEVWTVRDGVQMEVLEVVEKRAYIVCTVTYWSKHQDRRRDSPRTKHVRGWISLKDDKGWVL